MSNKISNKFKPSDCIYRLGGYTYDNQPKNTYIAYYLNVDDGYIAVLHRHIYILPIVAVICTVLFTWYCVTNKNVNTVKYTSSMSLSNNFLSLDLLNTTDSSLTVSVNVNDNLLYEGVVTSGQSLSNVRCERKFDKGSYSAKLKVTYKDVSKVYSVLIRVE